MLENMFARFLSAQETLKVTSASVTESVTKQTAAELVRTECVPVPPLERNGADKTTAAPVVLSATPILDAPSPAPPPRIDAPSSVAGDPICSKCGGSRHWKPRGMSQWVCSSCEPPPSLTMVGEETGVPKVVGQVAYCMEVDTCPKCSCRMVVEQTWSDGFVSLHCGSCSYEFDSVDAADVTESESQRIELYQSWRRHLGFAVPGLVKFKSDRWLVSAITLIGSGCVRWRNGRLVADESKWTQLVEAFRSEMTACELI